VIAPLAANAATVIVWHHTFVDFSVQNSAVALTWLHCWGCSAQSWSSGTGQNASGPSCRAKLWISAFIYRSALAEVNDRRLVALQQKSCKWIIVTI